MHSCVWVCFTEEKGKRKDGEGEGEGKDLEGGKEG